MHSRTLLTTLLLSTSTAFAQLLAQGNGALPSCAQSCTTLTTAQSQCNGASSTSLSAWSCFCQAVWQASGGSLATICSSSCTSATDNTAISTWYTNNCGSDNGASEHGGGNNAGSNTGATSSSAPSSLPSTTAASGTGVTGVNETDCPDWWSCHWKWIIMIIVIAIGLLVLGFGGRYLKKRHDRKKDRLSGNFNSGITHQPTHNPSMTNAYPNNASGDPNASYISASGGRDSPSRTREAFMPYGYGYTRSESRVDNSSPLARGQTPVGDLEKSEGVRAPADPAEKSRRVKVRERLMGEK